MIEIHIIGAENRADVNIPNEPFPIFGRLLPEYRGGEWSSSEEIFETTEEMRFPDENYDFDAMSGEHIFVGAYDGEACVGLAIYRHAWNRYLYLYDLKVNRAFRRCGAGALLIEAGMELAKEHGYLGLFTQAQDNNLAACRFYLKAGFRIRGMDTRVYHGTRQAGKSDILLYKDA